MKHSLVVFFISLIIEACADGDHIITPDTYNLGFDREISFIRSVDNWNMRGCPSRISLDTLHAKFGRASAEIDVYSSHHAEARSLHIFQVIYLPVTAEKMNISLWLKTAIFNGGYLKAFLLNFNEDIVSIDSLNLNESSNWEKYDLVFDGKMGRILFLEISLAQNSKVWLDQLEVNINEKSIYHYESQTKTLSQSDDSLDPGDVIPMQVVDTLNRKGALKEFSEKRVIGIGESVHGVHEMAETRNRLIKYLVKNEDCKLIILEAPDCVAESLNDYIQGLKDEGEVLNANDVNYAQFYIYSEEMFQLLKWLKEYNASKKDKVIIAGMDVSPLWEKRLTDLLLQYRNDKVIKEMIQFEQNSYSDSLVESVEENKTHLISILDKTQYDYLHKLSFKFNQFVQVYRSSFNNRARDSIMAENVKTLVDKYTLDNEKTVVCGHIAHLNKLNLVTSLTPSVGKRLSDYYKDKYSIIAQFVGKGNYHAYPISYSVNIHPLSSPSIGSIEEMCMKIPLESYYFPAQSNAIFWSRLMKFRIIGGIPKENQFYPGNLDRRIDGIIFLQQGTPLLLYNSKLK